MWINDAYDWLESHPWVTSGVVAIICTRMWVNRIWPKPKFSWEEKPDSKDKPAEVSNTYPVKIKCGNCKKEIDYAVSKGTHVENLRFTCTHCGCKMKAFTYCGGCALSIKDVDADAKSGATDGYPRDIWASNIEQIMRQSKDPFGSGGSK